MRPFRSASAARARWGVGATEPSQIDPPDALSLPPRMPDGRAHEGPVEGGLHADLFVAVGHGAGRVGNLDGDDDVGGIECEVGGAPALRRAPRGRGTRSRAAPFGPSTCTTAESEPNTGARLLGWAEAQEALPKMPAVSCTPVSARTGQASRTALPAGEGLVAVVAAAGVLREVAADGGAAAQLRTGGEAGGLRERRQALAHERVVGKRGERGHRADAQRRRRAPSRRRRGPGTSSSATTRSGSSMRSFRRSSRSMPLAFSTDDGSASAADAAASVVGRTKREGLHDSFLRERREHARRRHRELAHLRADRVEDGVRDRGGGGHRGGLAEARHADVVLAVHRRR